MAELETAHYQRAAVAVGQQEDHPGQRAAFAGCDAILVTRERHRRYSCGMRPLRYSINVTLDGCCDHRVGIADEELHRHAMENIAQANALLFGRVTYEMMEAAFRLETRTTLFPYTTLFRSRKSVV